MSHGDPLESLESELFQAARRERTRSNARESTANAVVAAARRQRSRRGTFAFIGALALAAGAALILRGPSRADSIQAEPIAPRHASSGVAALPSARAQSEPVIASSAAAFDEAEILRGGLAPSVASTTLEEEVVMLEGARAELAAGKADSALASLDRYDRVSGGHLTAQATLLRIQALSKSGRASLAAKLARRFFDSDPNGPFAEQARAYLANTPREAGNGRSGAGGEP